MLDNFTHTNSFQNKMATVQELVAKLAEANETSDFYEDELAEAEKKLSAVERKLAAMQVVESEMKEGMESMGAQLHQAQQQLDQKDVALKEEGEMRAALSNQLSRIEEAARAELNRHKEINSTLRGEYEAAIASAAKEQSPRETSGYELKSALATVAGLQIQLEMAAKMVREKNDLVIDLTNQRDAARGDLASTSSSYQTTVQSMDRANSEIAAKHEAALRELSASRDLLRAETAAKEQAQGAVQEFQGQFASIEAQIDAAINRIGCADTFVYQSKLDYISASAEEVLTLQAEMSKIHLELKQERETKQESGPAVPDVQERVDRVVEMSDELETELRSQIQKKTVEAARQAAKIKKQKRDFESQGVKVASLMTQVMSREERIRALEKQLAREQSRSRELQDIEAQNALLSRKLDLAIPEITDGEKKIAELQKQLNRQGTALVQMRGDKEHAETLLAETARKLEEIKEQSTFRRIANKIYILRIDKDKELIANHAAEIEKLKGALGQAKAESLRSRRPLINTPAFARQYSEMERRVRWEPKIELTEQIRARVRWELEKTFWSEKREDMEAEVAREFADMKRDVQSKGMGVSPIHVSLSDAGVLTPTANAPPSSAARMPPSTMRVVATFTVVNMVILFAAFSLSLFLGL
jgi:chromosome segregation ATPase